MKTSKILNLIIIEGKNNHIVAKMGLEVKKFENYQSKLFKYKIIEKSQYLFEI